jgi:peptidoglycan/xylan/chitin deacetylase (PgdA/CDA1 family)
LAAAASEGPAVPAADFSELMVLCYHAVSATWPSPAAVSPSELDRQLRLLLRRGYRPMTLAAALEAGAPKKGLVVTFDDAYASILESGLPVLERLEVPATVFVPTDSADEAGLMRWSELAQWVGGAHEQELRCMSWEQIGKLTERGWEVGSHTCSHPHLTELGDGELDVELETSRAACEERTQRPCTTLAYPFGSYDERVMSAVDAAGYEAAVTLDERLLEPLRGRGPLEVPREAIYRETGRPVFAAKTSRLVRRVRVSRAYAALA